MLWTKKLNTSKDFAERFRLDPLEHQHTMQKSDMYGVQLGFLVPSPFWVKSRECTVVKPEVQSCECERTIVVLLICLGTFAILSHLFSLSWLMTYNMMQVLY